MSAVRNPKKTGQTDEVVLPVEEVPDVQEQDTKLEKPAEVDVGAVGFGFNLSAGDWVRRTWSAMQAPGANAFVMVSMRHMMQADHLLGSFLAVAGCSCLGRKPGAESV
jgi:hypothetical protein